MDRQADILAAGATPFTAAPLVPGGVRIGGLLYASTELESVRLAGAGPTVMATVDPVDPVFALAIMPGGLRLVRAEAVFTPGEFQRQAQALLRVLDGIDAVLAEVSR